jgi:hypothetical protein
MKPRLRTLGPTFALAVVVGLSGAVPASDPEATGGATSSTSTTSREREPPELRLNPVPSLPASIADGLVVVTSGANRFQSRLERRALFEHVPGSSFGNTRRFSDDAPRTNGGGDSAPNPRLDWRG